MGKRSCYNWGANLHFPDFLKKEVFQMKNLVYSFMWIGVSAVIATAIIITKSAMPLWTLIIPMLATITVNDKN